MFVKRDKMISDWDNYQPGDVLDITRKSPADFIDEIKMDYIKPYLPQKGTILEVGAGSGRLLTRIGLEHKDTYRLIGVDYSPSSVEIIKANIDQHKLHGISVCGDVRALRIEENSIDMVCSGGLLEHFNISEINKVLCELARVLKPGGFFYADIVPRKRSLCRPIIRKDAGGYESNFTIDTWRLMLNHAGFLNIYIFSGLVLPPNFYNRWTSNHRINFMYKHKDFIKSLDNTLISNILGFAFFVFAKKG